MTTRHMRSAMAAAALSLFASCKVAAPSRSSGVDQPRVVDAYDPPRDLGPIFERVQVAGVFDDSKTFVDARPRSAPSAILARYTDASRASGFNLRAFVDSNFDIPRPVGGDFHTDTAQTMEEHIRA